MTTKHNHGANFGRIVKGCPRCDELRVGFPAVKWNNFRARSDAMRLADIRAHECKRAGCGPVCTFGDY